MRHLKGYKVFEELGYDETMKLLEDDIQAVNDILMELTDDNYKVYISPSIIASGREKGKPILTIMISISRDTKEENLPSNISDYLLTVDSYLKSEGWVGYIPRRPDDHRVVVNFSGKLAGNKYVEKQIEDIKEYTKMMKGWFDSVSLSYYKK